MVGSRFSHQGAVSTFAGCWNRPPSGRSSGELEELSGLLQPISFNHGAADSWTFGLDPKGVFSTSGLSKLIDEKILRTSNSSSLGTIRNNLVPKKVDVFVWRVLKRRIPILVELDKRGVDLHSVRCPNCDNDIESISHYLLSCEKVCNVWNRIFDWWSLPRPPNSVLSSLLGSNSGQNNSGLGNQVWQAVLWTCIYLVWKFRNEKVFKKKDWSVPVAVCEIQVKSFEWVSRRCKDKHFDWNIWLHNPCTLFT
ncbi:uncharacterized protein [Rutidosis leptorrhynchoides]|uniref:uncharacterized protein n=1 Tax=Rutidosis leptorrhynchoides TaxID=125765 RepID=UPI003A98E4AF